MRSIVIKMLAAKGNLPEEMKALFDALFIRGEPDSLIAEKKGLSAESFAKEKDALMRSLMAESSKVLS